MISVQTASRLMRSHVDYVSDVPPRRKPRQGYALTIVLFLIAATALAFIL